MIIDMNQKHQRRVSGIDSEMLARLVAHDWPGNVRELRIPSSAPSFSAPKASSSLAPSSWLWNQAGAGVTNCLPTQFSSKVAPPSTTLSGC